MDIFNKGCVFFFLLLNAVGTATSAGTDHVFEQFAEVLPDRAVFSLNPNTPQADRESLIKRTVQLKGVTRLRTNYLLKHWFGVDFDAGKIQFAQLRALLLKEKTVRFVEPVVRYSLTSDAPVPDDFYFPDLWSLKNTGQKDSFFKIPGKFGADLRAPEAWKAAGELHPNPLPEIVVGIIDTGTWTHPDLENRFYTNPAETLDGVDNDGNGCIDDWIGCDFSSLGLTNASDLPRGSGTNDQRGHGTHVAGIIAANVGNKIGVAGVGNWANIKLIPVIVTESPGSPFMTADNIANGIVYAVDQGAKIINLSLGGPYDLQMVREAVEYANSHGVLLIVAAGNSNSDNNEHPLFPANYSKEYSGVLTVGATDGYDQRAFFSSYGEGIVSIFAPGQAIVSTVPPDVFALNYSKLYIDAEQLYARLSGTSMAAPAVSAMAAILWTLFPTDTASEIRTRIEETGDPLSALYAYSSTHPRRANLENAVLQSAPLPLLSPPGVYDPQWLPLKKKVSFHPGKAGEKKIFTLTLPEKAKWIQIKFKKLNLKPMDYVWLEDGDGSPIQRIQGKLENHSWLSYPLYFPQGTEKLKIRFQSLGKSKSWGLATQAIQYIPSGP